MLFYYKREHICPILQRETLHTSTLIDHVAVSDPRNIVDSGILKITMSDHYMVFCIRKFRGVLIIIIIVPVRTA